MTQKTKNDVSCTRCRRRALPSRLVVSVLLVLASVMLSTLVGCSRNPKVQAEKHYARAEKFLKENNPDAAIIELRSAIQLNPKLAKAHFELANIELQRGAPQIAFQEYVAATRADGKHRQAQVMVGEMLARARNFSEARGQAQLILSNWPDEKVGTLLLAESSFGLQDYKEAQSLIDEFLASDPNNIRALSDLAYLQLHDKKVSDAEATFRRAWQLDPKQTSAVAALSSVYEVTGDLPSAESVLKQAQQQNNGDIPFDLLLANFYIRHQRPADAEPLYRQIQQKGKDQAEYRDILAEFYIMANRPKDAEAEYRRLLEINKKDWQSWRGLALVYLGEGQYDQASDAIERLLKNNSKDWQTLALKGKLLLARGQPAEAIAELQKSHKSNPAAAETSFDLAKAYIAVGKIEEAQTALQDVLKANPEYPGAIDTLAAIQLSQSHVDQAIEDLTREAAARPEELGTRLLLAQAHMAKGDLAAAEADLKIALSLATTDAARGTVLQSEAELKLQQKQYAQATKLAGEALDLRPKSNVSLSVLGASYVAQKQPDQAIQAMQARLERTPDWSEGFETLGRLARQTGHSAVALAAFNKALSIDPKRTTAMLGLADTLLMTQQLDLAQQQYEKVASQQDSNRSYALLRVGQIYEKKGDFTNAQTSYENAIAANQDNILAKNNLAWLYAEHGGNVDVALKLAEEAKEKAPNDPGIADTLGWIYIKKGSYEAALENLKDSASKEPNNASYLYHLGTAYYKLGRNDQARKELEAALKMPNFGDAADARKILDLIPAK
jgi:FimV-like protein